MSGSPHPVTEFPRVVLVNAAGVPITDFGGGEGGGSISSDQLPEALGPQTSALSLSVTPASDAADVVALDAIAGRIGTLNETTATSDADVSAASNALLRALLREAIVNSAAWAAAEAETDPVPVVTPSNLIPISLVVDTNVLADGDVMAATQELAGVLRVNGGRTWLQSIVAIDTDDQGVKFDLVIMNANTSIGAVNSAPDIDDTEVLTVIGIVRGIGETDSTLPSYSPFIDLGGSRVATRTNIGLLLEASATSVWIAAITRGAPTYASGALPLRFGFAQD